MLVDTHCHLDAAEFSADVEAVHQAASDAGVARIVIPAVDPSHFGTVTALCRRWPDCRYALGIHPLFVRACAMQALAGLRVAVRAALDDPAFVGIGEIGMDHFVPDVDRGLQRDMFAAQLELAVEFALPVILHVRRAQDEVLKQLRRYRPRSGIAHAFNGSLQQAGVFLDLGFALGFGGGFTWTRALQLRRLVADLPAHAHVLETDAPDIPPAWIGRGRNAPAELPRIAAEFARLRGMSVEEVIATTGANACRVLPRLA